jgi:hemoglobin
MHTMNLPHIDTPVSPSPSAVRADLAGREDIDALLRDFYGRTFADPLLGPVFVDIARMDLDQHLPVIGDFWQTTLFHAGLYRRNAFTPHQLLDQRAHLTPQHFQRWLDLWRATVHDRHQGPRADLAELQATRIAGSMSRRITGHPLPDERDHDLRAQRRTARRPR